LSAPRDTLSPLKHALTSTVQALAQDKKLAVRFAAQGDNSHAVTLPELTEYPAAHALPIIRGVGDYAALTHRLHNKSQHAANRPSTPGNAKLFDMLEGVRVEAEGSRHLLGVQYNFARRYEMQAMQAGLRASSLGINDMLELLARRYVQQLPIPAFLASALEHPAPELAALTPRFEALANATAAQDEFAQHALKLIEEVAQIAWSTQPGKESGEQSTTQNSEGETPQDNETDEAMPAPSAGAESTTQSLQRMMMKAGGPMGEEPPEDSQEIRMAGAAPTQEGHNSLAMLPEAYQAYTHQFDEIVQAQQLASPTELDLLARQLEQKLTQFSSITSRLAARLQRLLLARQARSWIYDQEDGILDSRKLARVIIHPDYEMLYKHEKDSEFRDTVVTLLIDNSGSMRGRPITIAALSADIISRTLERCGVKVEVLGFTTREWKGGHSHKQWVKDGKPAQPGRLNDLRHIIYKSADVSWRKGRRNLALMLKDGLLKENIDGEAILWACERLMARPEQRRILMVISDGAPVDDSTLSVNNSRYLDTHLREVIARIENHTPIELVAIGIGHDVTRYYKRAVTISEIEKLGETMSQQLSELFREKKKTRR